MVAEDVAEMPCLVRRVTGLVAALPCHGIGIRATMEVSGSGPTRPVVSGCIGTGDFEGRIMSLASTLLPGSTIPTKVLVVDDSEIDQRLTGTLIEKDTGWKAVYARGREALEVIDREKPNVILTDLIIQGMSGLELVDVIRARYPLVPIILITSKGSEEIAIQALKRGAASYVPKKSMLTDLVDTLEQVLAAAQTDRQQQRLLGCLAQLESHFVLENDRSLVPPLIAYFQEQMARLQLCDQATRVRVGVAVEEALLNAIFHGNLEVSSKLREEDDTAYHRLAEERRHLHPYRERRIHLRAALSRNEAVFVVRDEGPGFDPAQLPDPTDPENLEQTTGRGLLLIQTFMDEIAYNRSGNELTMIKRRTETR
jgi:CheY-like chemotaxis protein/anti-sigma regulatory factor (Ser/Thr protein kinase)